jgi:DNA-binding response OmpR family regulator
MYALLIAQDPDETAILSLVLQRSGLAVTIGNNLERALSAWSERPADLILLVVGENDPRKCVQRVRSETEVPLVLIVNRLQESIHFDLLEAGADLLLGRPFSARLLIAQIRSILRRARGVPLFTLPTLSLAGLTLDPATRSVQVAGQPLRRLTHLEFRLLYTLMIHRGQALPAETIQERVWGYGGEGDRELVRGLISRLRSKVERDPRHPHYVLTVPGLGYAFREEDGGALAVQGRQRGT